MTQDTRPPLDRWLDLPTYRLRPLGLIFALIAGSGFVWLAFGVLQYWEGPNDGARLKVMVTLYPYAVVAYTLIALPIWGFAHVFVTRHPLAAGGSGALVGQTVSLLAAAQDPPLALATMGAGSGLCFWFGAYRREEPLVSPQVFE